MKRTQIGWVFLVVVPLILILVTFQNPDAKAWIIISAAAIVVLLLFYKLTIEVTDSYVKYSFGIGWIRGKYRLQDIVHCKPVTYTPMGWGIRWRPGVILFNVAGYKAIELKIKNKVRKVWIGTNCPQEIVAYIQKQIK